MTVLTGVKPTGKPHLGNYLGAMLPALRAGEGRRPLLFIADYHALTTVTNAAELRRLSYEVAATWLAIGLDPETATIYRQSDIPETFELFWLLCCATPKGLMNRAHAYKAMLDENAQLGRDPDAGVNMGLYDYPVLMAADILLFDVNLVPVGKDQGQHVEMTRDIAERFNHAYGPVLVVPELLPTAEPEPILGLDGRKMSKSYDNAIPLFAASDELRKLLRRYTTDSTAADAPKDPDANGLFRIYADFASTDEASAVRAALAAGRMTWGALKELAFETIDARVAPLRERYDELIAQPQELERILLVGAEKARTTARATMRRVRAAVGASDR
ncbi:MAG: tryptophan--tRNA ligase [Candidatus Elarobacter sp.]